MDEQNTYLLWYWRYCHHLIAYCNDGILTIQRYLVLSRIIVLGYLARFFWFISNVAVFTGGTQNAILSGACTILHRHCHRYICIFLVIYSLIISAHRRRVRRANLSEEISGDCSRVVSLNEIYAIMSAARLSGAPTRLI